MDNDKFLKIAYYGILFGLLFQILKGKTIRLKAGDRIAGERINCTDDSLRSIISRFFDILQNKYRNISTEVPRLEFTYEDYDYGLKIEGVLSLRETKSGKVKIFSLPLNLNINILRHVEEKGRISYENVAEICLAVEVCALYPYRAIEYIQELYDYEIFKDFMERSYNELNRMNIDALLFTIFIECIVVLRSWIHIYVCTKRLCNSLSSILSEFIMHDFDVALSDFIT